MSSRGAGGNVAGRALSVSGKGSRMTVGIVGKSHTGWGTVGIGLDWSSAVGIDSGMMAGSGEGECGIQSCSSSLRDDSGIGGGRGTGVTVNSCDR